MKNYQASVCRYQPWPSASVYNDKLRLDNSSYHAQSLSIIVKHVCHASADWSIPVFAGCDNSRNQRTGGTPNVWSGTSLFLGTYHVGTRKFAIRVLTFSF